VLAEARLYFVTGIEPGLDRLLAEAFAGGVEIAQLRDKQASDDAIVRAGEIFRRRADEAGALFVVNDRPELALRCGADGVHVGQDDLSVPAVRELVGPDLLIGLSTHSPEQIAAAAGADYIGVGPVYATPTKAGRAAVGLELVREAAASAAVPWFAIGGIDLENVDEVVAAGAGRVAVVRAIRDAADPRATAAELRRRLPPRRRPSG
jgi:thiamine-phosphate pyrophosphorylase